MSFLEFRKFAPLVEVCEGGHEQLGDHLVPTRCVVELRRSPAWVSGKDEIEERHLELGASSTSGDVRATTASSIAAISTLLLSEPATPPGPAQVSQEVLAENFAGRKQYPTT
jgi:hypothetical protein